MTARFTRKKLEGECEVMFIKAGGPGGQHRNKTESGVRLIHLPTGTAVTATERRSQAQNLAVAYERLAQKLSKLFRPVKTRKPTRPSRASVERRLKTKKARSEIKDMRRKTDE
jgi:protein subunit release factor B